MVRASDSAPVTHPGPAEDTRSDLDLARQQLAGIDRWHEARRATRQAAQRTTSSREARMDLGRRLEVVRAEHAAIVARTDAHLRSSVELLQRTTPRRAVLAHRNAWFLDKVAADLGVRDITVVAVLDDGAAAIGAVVAEQPDLLLVEDSLPMVSGEDVVRDVRAFAPSTRITAQVAHDDRIAAMLEAGAHSACTRRVPPADVAAALAELLTASGSRV